MRYPLISEYVEAIRSAEDNFDKLVWLRPVLDGDGNPVMSSGNFAVVFKMRGEGDGKFYALKCFTREQEGREEAYRLIADELECVQTTYLAKVAYHEGELFVDAGGSGGAEYPVLLMDWVEGVTLDMYLRRHVRDAHALRKLSYGFSRLATWLLPQPFAHGDLKPDNIIVRPDGTLTLVDYDGMFVPAMRGRKSRESGSPDFRHPLRTEDDFNEHIDDFPAVSILLSLRLIAEDPGLLDEYGASDRLLFSEGDYRDLSSCKLLRAVFPSRSAEVNTLVSLFTLACMNKTLSQVSFRLLSVEKPKKSEQPEEEMLSTEVTEEDLADAVKDEFGAKYSKDGKRLLKGRGVKTYKIREGTRVICDEAFFWCGKLKSVVIPSSVTDIGKNPFVYCKCDIESHSPHFKVKDSVLYDSDMSVLIAYLSEQTVFYIPSSVTQIGDCAFRGCVSLKSVSIPPSVTDIGDYAFGGCGSLQSVAIPSGVTRIGDSAFYGCKSLQSVSIPSSVTRIGKNPFAGCKCGVESHSPRFKVKDNVLYNSDMSVLIAYLSGQTVFSIPLSVTRIGDRAFSGCGSLQSVVIPSSVTQIGDRAFSGCVSLQSVVIPSSVTRIGDGAFYGCVSLQSVVIPSGVTQIGDCAFFRCRSLRSVVIPSSVTRIGDYAFSSCGSLESVVIPSGVTQIGDRAFWGCESLQSVVIPPSVTDIGDYAFGGCGSLRSVVIPSSVTRIGDSAFYGCDSLQSVVIPSGITRIGDSAFERCGSLQSVVILSGITRIGDNAFRECWGLKSVVIPSSVTQIGNSAFSGCGSLQSVAIPLSVIHIGKNPFAGCKCDIESHSPYFKVKDNVLYDSDMSVLIAYLSEQTVFFIPSSVTQIGGSAFGRCGKLQSVSIPSSVTHIGDGAFSGCGSLQSVSIPSSVTHIGDGAFSGCGSLQSVSISSSVTHIGDSAFSECKSLQFVSIPSSVTRIGDRAFYGCESLKSVAISAFWSCYSLQFFFTVPSSLTHIGGSAFSWCKSLESVFIPSSVTHIGDKAFEWCDSLQQIRIPKGSREKFEKLLPYDKDRLVEI